MTVLSKSGERDDSGESVIGRNKIAACARWGGQLEQREQEMMIFRVVAVSLLIGALSACGSLLDQAVNSKPGDNAFLASLHGEYVALAQAEQDELDFLDADHFAAKAIDAAGGKMVKPDAADSRTLPAGAKGALAAAERRLSKAFDGGARDYAPKDAARAQAMYDCWLQEQEENDQPKDIARCRSAYLDAMDRVDAAKPKETAKKEEPKPKPKKRPSFLGPFFVYFAFDSSDPEDPFNDDIFKLIVDTAKKADDMQLHVTGHTDRAGSSKYNMALSEKRAYSVKAALIERGVGAKRMQIFYMGEEAPATPTKDGVRNDSNRRVEVTFK